MSGRTYTASEIQSEIDALTALLPGGGSVSFIMQNVVMSNGDIASDRKATVITQHGANPTVHHTADTIEEAFNKARYGLEAERQIMGTAA